MGTAPRPFRVGNLESLTTPPITSQRLAPGAAGHGGVVVVRDVRLGWGEEWVRQGCGEEWLFLEVYCAGSQVGPLQGLETTSQT